jgi:para-nitrobenzyl esterase
MKRILMGMFGAMLAIVPHTAWAAITDPIKIDSGQLSGESTATATVRVYKGIPFAAPPTGENRWRAPQPVAKWDGIRKADAFGAPCLANAGAGGGRRGAPGGGGGRGRGGRGAPGAAPGGGGPGVPAAPGRGATGQQGATSTTGIVLARAQAPAARGGGAGREPANSEDCLYTNVWTNAEKASDKRPVIVWVYGGGFSGGSGGMAWYDGEHLASKGAVVVTFNYRLGAFGFFVHPELAKESGHNASGNYGVMDAIAMLQWVKKNISAFGGDPNNVTLAGESAGAIMIGALVGSPHAKGLFGRVINESGTYMGVAMAKMATAQRALEQAPTLESLGVKSLAELRAKPAAELNGVRSSSLVVDGYIFTEDVGTTFANGKENAVDVLAGSNKDEGTFGICGQALTTLDAFKAQAQRTHGADADAFLKMYPASTDAEAAAASITACGDNANWNARQYAAAEAKKGKKAYVYFFTRVPLDQQGKPSARGASHTTEISYAFNNEKGQASQNWDATDRKLADTMSSYWVNFATRGDPNGAGLPQWPQFKDINSKVMVLGDTVQPEASVPTGKNAFYTKAYEKLMKP